jgi:hypothetical protein
LDFATAAGSPLSNPAAVVATNGVDTSQPTMGILQHLLEQPAKTEFLVAASRGHVTGRLEDPPDCLVK